MFTHGSVGVKGLAWRLCSVSIGRKPKAQPKEGSDMRVHSIAEVNTHLQENPFVTQATGYASTGKPASGLTFEDYLKLYIPQKSPPAVSNQTVSQVAGLYWGFSPLLRVQQKSESTLDADAG
jgi:hypothetical protein